MEDTVCEICIQEYKSGVIVPRVLDCGHSICTSCTTQQLHSSRICPKCRGSLSKITAEAYPINYALLSLMDSLNSSTNQEIVIKKRITDMKRKFATMEKQLAENKSRVDSNLFNITVGLTHLQDLLDENKVDVDQTNIILSDLNEKFESVLKKSTTFNYRQLRHETTLNRNEFDSNESYLQNIYNRISDDEEFYAVTKIEEEIKFARLTNWSNKILVHAFGPPIRKNDIKTIWFNDLKRSLNNKLLAFLDIYCNEQGKHLMIIVKTLNSSLVPQILKYCTGETGPVYKGASFYHGTSDLVNHMQSILKVDHFMLDGNESHGNYEYVSKLGTNSVHGNPEIVCTATSDGSLQIFKMLSTDINVQDVTGIVEEPRDLVGKITFGSDLKIKDSGILIEL